MTHGVTTHDRRKCDFCRHFNEFTLPDHFLTQLTANNVVVFAGAGVSTEDSLAFSGTLYERVRQELGIDDDEQVSFPALMTRYCSRPDGRSELLQKILRRFQYISSFPSQYGIATRFHRELSTLFYIDTYFTTNWDDYFERECGAIPFVTASDFALWNMPGRKVFKIHGSINNPGSIIATEEDYRRTRQHLQRGALGATLKYSLATKTILFAGYSLSDSDFLAIHNYIRRELKSAAPTAYILTIDESHADRAKDLGITPIVTDATYFLQVVKKHLATDEHFLPDDRFEGVYMALMAAESVHHKTSKSLNISDYPQVAYTLVYQDGLIQALQRIVKMERTGEYSHRCDVHRRCQHYEQQRLKALEKKAYIDVAYIDGYLNGMLWLLCDDATRRQIPFFFLFGTDDPPRTLKAYVRAIKSGKQHRETTRYAARLASRIGPDQVVHHTPFLDVY